MCIITLSVFCGFLISGNVLQLFLHTLEYNVLICLLLFKLPQPFLSKQHILLDVQPRCWYLHLPDLDFSFEEQRQAGSTHFYASLLQPHVARCFSPPILLFTALASRKKPPVTNSSWLWRIGIIATLLKQESYISNKFWNVPHQNYSAVDSYDKNCPDDKTRFPKGCSQQGRPCVKIAFEGTEWSWSKWTEKQCWDSKNGGRE